ncbi:hypothetical protein [Duganella callida]|uniref:Uncharacterized protein n=1 Tax=Duganella callida TaxID=2561932 RepID=A0A4Y9S600_9BURK|nr:hypothetical protein [Duganella callida]TFW15909.1 hypothetical protein E4L98_24735 [Duganella callida]
METNKDIQALSEIDLVRALRKAIESTKVPDDFRAALVGYFGNEVRAILVARQPAPAVGQQAGGVVMDEVIDALTFYADGNHFARHAPDAWDTVSGEPSNFLEDRSNTATVEDGWIAKAALEKLLAAHPPADTAPVDAKPVELEQLHTAAAQHKMALVPLHLTRGMLEVLADEWEWEDLLAAAEAITDEQYAEVCAGPSAAQRRVEELEYLLEAAQPSNAQGEAVPWPAQQNGGLVRSALIDVMVAEKFALNGAGDFQSQSDLTARFARARQALAATAGDVQGEALNQEAGDVDRYRLHEHSEGAYFHKEGEFVKYSDYAALAQRGASQPDSEHDAATPAAVIAWHAAEKARIEAVGKYNGKLAAAKDHDFPGPDVSAEFKVMTDAGNVAHRLLRPMYEAIAAMAAQHGEKGGAA